MRGSARLSSFFRKGKADALLLASGESPNPNFLYFSGMQLDNSVFIAGRNGERTLLVNEINETEAKNVKESDVVVFKDRRDFWKKATDALLGCRLISLDMNEMNARAFSEIQKRIMTKKFVDGSKTMLELRAVKEESELELIRKSARIARSILSQLHVKVGITELELAKELRIKAIENGCALSFEPIVLAGSNTAMPHGKPSGKKVSQGEVVLVDFGVKYNSYCSDITRCFFIGKCEEERQRYAELKSVLEDLLKGLRVGVLGGKVGAVCNELMVESGFGKMIHSPGHGIGLDVHENPSLSKKSRERLANGMAIAIEPAFYGKYGLRYEDDVVVDAGRARII